jgi:hypothetical protein
MACADDDGMAEAEERIDTALHAHPVGTAVVMAEVGGDGVEGALGGAWHGQDLADWLAVCGTNEATWDVQLVLRAGSWPHTLDDAGEAPSCITQRLTTFPFEEPSRRGEEALLRVRWRPAEPTGELAWAHGHGEVPSALLAQSPPYYRRSPSGHFLKSDLVLSSPERLRVDPESDVITGPLADAETWARQLTCPGETLTLVRTSLLFVDGTLKKSETSPESDCVSERADAAEDWFSAQSVGDARLVAAGRVLVVLDVPMGPW